MWTWDGMEWLARESDWSQPRYGHALAFDSIRGVVVVFGGQNGLSDTVELQLADGPDFIEQPQSQIVDLFKSAQFSVSALGTGSLSYQWRKDGDPIRDGPSMTGTATATLTIESVHLTDEGVYDVLVADEVCAELSRASWLDVVTQTGDINGDGAVNVDDLIMLIQAWGYCGECPEDLNNNEFVNVVDLILLLDAWTT
jgi:hypothetical protein